MEEHDRLSPILKTILPAAVILDIAGLTVRGIPCSLGLLAITAGLALLLRRRAICSPLWLQGAFLGILAAGLLPLTRAQLGGGVKEWVQAALSLGLTWGVFAVCNPSERFSLRRSLAAIAGIFLIAGLGFRFAEIPCHLSAARFSMIAAILFPFLVDQAFRSGRCDIGVPICAALALIAIPHGGLMLCALLGGAVVVALHRSKPRLRVAIIGGTVIGAAMFLNGAAPWDVLRLTHPGTGNLKRLYVEWEATPFAVNASPLTGHGLGTYKDVIHGYTQRLPDADDNRILPDTNATYLLWAVEAGAPAALLFLALLLTVAAGALRRSRVDAADIAAAGAVVVVIPAGIFCVLISRETGLLLGGVLGLSIAGAPLVQTAAWQWVARLVLPAVLVAGFLGANLSGIGGKHAVADMGESPGTLGPLIIEAAEETESEYWLIEAEAPVKPPDGAMLIAGANHASGNKVLKIPEKAGKGRGTSTYLLPKLPPGDYTIWVRAWWLDGCGNSIGVVLDNQTIVIGDEIFKRWHWVMAIRRLKVTEGTTEIHLKNTEDGIMIDQFLLTQDPMLVPYEIMKPYNPPVQP